MMPSRRTNKWPAERLEQIKALMIEGFSMAKIGEKLTPPETRMAVLGIIHRNPDIFKNVPRLPALKPVGSRSRGQKRKLDDTPLRPPAEVKHDDPSALAEMTKLDHISNRPLVAPWVVARRGDKLFFYWKLETEPTYRFTRPGAGANWRGHGVYSMTLGAIYAWVNAKRK